jgi:rhamnose transport system substrate-binding protein
VKADRRQQLILGGLIAFEIVLFSFTGRNFLSLANFFECIRLAVEIGLLSVALTPVIVTGGIDLSVGSLMGLCAVTFGAFWHDVHLSIATALFLTVLVSLAGGAINALAIARLNVSPLIVTLGTYSLFRGLAEGLTAGARSYSGFPKSFLYLGQGYLGGFVPTQTIVLAVAIAGFWILLHRSAIGRALYAIGHSAVGTRYAAIPVARRLALVYLLSGLAAGLAAIIYVAHLGQAKSDAGTGYELVAITAVVLGGTSIFGGSGSIVGTLLGLTAITVLQNGLALSAWPGELAGIATGVLLILTIALDRMAARFKTITAPWAETVRFAEGRNRTLLRRGVPIGLAIMVIGGWFLVHAPGSQRGIGLVGTKGEKRVTVGVMPKALGDPYFISCRSGAEEAANALNVDLLWNGPTGLDAAKQNEVIQQWITRHVDAIAVAVENGPAISTVLRKARAAGIKVVTWDADAEPDARDYFINQATPQSIGYTLMDESARVMHDQGEFAIITGALTAANQNRWISYIQERVAQKYPKMKLVALRPSDDDRDKAFSETQTILKVYPNVRVVIAISAPAVPGAAEAVKQSGRDDVQVVGLSLPNLCKPYVHQGQIEAVVLWKTKDLGYLAVEAAAALARGTFPSGRHEFEAGRLGKLQVVGTDIVLGAPFIFRKNNIDKFNF